MRFLCALLAVVFALTASVCDAAKKKVAKNGSAPMSATVRINKRGKRVDLQQSPEYIEAMVDFKFRRFGLAAEKFEDLDTHGYCCDMVHYYIAQCYHQTNQLGRAQMHYQWVSSYSKDSRLRQYASYASQGLAYYGNNRTYAGQGNNFERFVSRPAGGGGGGGGGGFG